MNYTWKAAEVADIGSIIELSDKFFNIESQDIIKVDKFVGARNLNLAIVNQFYNPLSELISVACDIDNKVIAWTWVKRGQRMAWSDEELAFINMAHVDQSLQIKTKIQLVKDMLELWEAWAKLANIPIICSTTMRDNQSAFLKLHLRHGYIIRGCSAYKRLSA